MGAPRIDRLDRNFVINGNFDFWQRVVNNVSVVNTATPTALYTADRFKFITLGATTKSFQIQRAADVPTLAQSGASSIWSSLLTINAASAAYAAADVLSPWSYTIEGLDYQLLHSQTITLSFWFKCSTAGLTLPISFRNADGSRSYVTTFVTGAANVWTQIFVPVVLDSQGTWLFDTGAGLNFAIGSAAGSTYQTSTVGAWQSGNYFATPTSANLNLTNGLTARIAQVQVMLGSYTAPPVFRRSSPNLALELHACQRYFERLYDVETLTGAPIINGSKYEFAVNTSAFQSGGTNYFKVFKRVLPTIIIYAAQSGVINAFGVAIGTGTAPAATYYLSTVCFSCGGSLASGQNYQYYWTADAEY
jgi:hypothetical protein